MNTNELLSFDNVSVMKGYRRDKFSLAFHPRYFDLCVVAPLVVWEIRLFVLSCLWWQLPLLVVAMERCHPVCLGD